jgi:ankyrin repeat protein
MHLECCASTPALELDVLEWIHSGSQNAPQGHQIDRYLLQTTLEKTASRGLLSLFNTLRTDFREFVDVNQRMPNPNRDGEEQTCLSLAAGGGHSEIVKILVREYTVDLDVGRPLWWASRNGYKEVVEILRDSSDIDVNEEYSASAPLGIAALRNHIDVMKTLLQHDDIDVNAAYDGRGDDYTNGRTPLSMAVSNGSLKAVRLMLAQPSVDVNAMDLGGRTPLSIAAELKSHEEIIRLLLEHKDINPTITDADGRDALWHHAKAKNTLAAKMIKKRLNAVTKQTKARWLRENTGKKESHRVRMEQADRRWTVTRLVEDENWEELDKWIVTKPSRKRKLGSD